MESELIAIGSLEALRAVNALSPGVKKPDKMDTAIKNRKLTKKILGRFKLISNWMPGIYLDPLP